jgi:hypothetical protein
MPVTLDDATRSFIITQRKKGIPADKIADTLNERGARRPDGKKFNRSHIYGYAQRGPTKVVKAETVPQVAAAETPRPQSTIIRPARNAANAELMELAQSAKRTLQNPLITESRRIAIATSILENIQ